MTKRITEKTKDLVEIRPYKRLNSYLIDPAQTLSSYYFTDATADMMAKWLDSVADVAPENGAAKALAGYRGVGKSHFLATLGSIVSQPELRTRVTDSHVATGAQRLKRRRHLVAHVQRGTAPTLFEELKGALAALLEAPVETLSDDPAELLAEAAQRAGDSPLVLVIDTAQDRHGQVKRDDGQFLGNLAAIAKNLNVFVGVALDDDIAGADGVNAAIAQNFAIDYLDQEHLYRIVDIHLFPKKRQTQAKLHEVYTALREVMPGFRWSEQRFLSLFPLHPAIIEVTPFVRYYAPDFSLLSFAAEAGAKIGSRPAGSLIALDEVFDRAEADLRRAGDLAAAFKTYDEVSSKVISQVPIMQRLQAKMVLKGLLLLSLDGEGTTIGDIASAILYYDENDPQKAYTDIRGILDTFVAALPDGVRVSEEEGREARYSLQISGKDDLNAALAEAATKVDAQEIDAILRRVAKDRFVDLALVSETGNELYDTLDLTASWRGCARRGRLVWDLLDGGKVADPESRADFLDWEMQVVSAAQAAPIVDSQSVLPMVYWKAAALRADEEDAIRRYSALLQNAELRDSYGEKVRAVGHTLLEAIRKAWNRTFLDDACIWIDGEEYPLGDEVLASDSISTAVSRMLLPLFEARFPQHPYFEEPLLMGHVSALVKDLFSGARQPSPDLNRLAENYALPLGLVVEKNGAYTLESEEKIAALPFMQGVYALITGNGDQVTSFAEINREMRKAPFGLGREAQRLGLAALVAQRKLEFVTSKGDRINRRSLDLKIIWDDVVGVVRPAELSYNAAALTPWAKLLTGDKTLRSIDTAADRENIKAALEKWLSDWNKAELLKRFEALPDEVLNSKVWRLAERAHKTFGQVASAIESYLAQSITLEETLQRAADAFSGSTDEFATVSQYLIELEDFIVGAVIKEDIWKYVALCEITDDKSVETLRNELHLILDRMEFGSNDSLNQRLQANWQEFKVQYSDNYAVNHDRIMKSHHLQEQVGDIMQSNEWWEFENLSRIPVFQHTHWDRARQMREKLRDLNCSFEVREIVKSKPICACSFRLSEFSEWEEMPIALRDIVNQGRVSYRRALNYLKKDLVPVLEEMARAEGDKSFADSTAWLAKVLASGSTLPLLGNTELRALELALTKLPASATVKLTAPASPGEVNADELREQLNTWLDDLPNEPVLVNLLSHGGAS